MFTILKQVVMQLDKHAVLSSNRRGQQYFTSGFIHTKQAPDVYKKHI